MPKRPRPLAAGNWLLALPLLCFSVWGALAQPSDQEVVVAIVEDWASDRVLARDVLTREEMESLLLERADSFVIGIDPQELIKDGDASPRSGSAPHAAAAGPAANPEDFFARSRQGLLGQTASAEATTAESASAAPARSVLVTSTPAPAGPVDPRDPRATLELGLQRLRRELASGGEQELSESMDRLRRRYQGQIVNDWVDQALMTLEAQRRGLTVTEEQIAAALVPLLQARRSQLEELQRSEPERADLPEQLRRAQDLLARAEVGPTAFADPGLRASLRAEVEALLREEGHSPERFFEELRRNLLAEQLIRATVYEFYSEEDLRAYHRTYPQQFVLPPRVRYLSVKYIVRADDTPERVEEIREALGRLARRLRRIGPGEPLEAVAAAWRQALESEHDLPALTYVSLSEPQTVLDMPPRVAEVLSGLDIGETSEVVEVDTPEGQRIGLYILRPVELIPALGEEFEDARPRVEERFFDQVRAQLREALRQRYHIWINTSGKPFAEALADLGSPGM